MNTEFQVHGGAGTIEKKQMTDELESIIKKALNEALTVGRQILSEGGAAVHAVERVTVALEDSPLFNAGKGSVFTSTGIHELDASIMEGKSLNAGAVAAVKHIRNPVTAARLVMEASPHILLTGEGAEEFARERDVALVSPEYFYTERRWRQYIARKEREVEMTELESSQDITAEPAEEMYGTVGAVACDKEGNVAAATSTGGTTFKRLGRVGDSPVIGAGTYADNRTCAVSGTGTGEYFIRIAAAHHVSALMAYEGLSVQKACDKVIHEKLSELEGEGGVIAIDAERNMGISLNSEGMYRGWIGQDGNPVAKIYKES